jgi:riboflavin transporter FmnP
MKKNKTYLEKVVGISIFSALAFVVALMCNVIPPVQGFLSLDVKDAVIAIASFIYGPISGVLIAFIAAFIEFLTFSTTAWYGFIMNFASSAVFSLTAALIYKFRRTLNGALIGFFSAVIATTGVMLLLNSFVTPIYLIEFLKMPEAVAKSTVVELLPKVLLPFNLAKSIMNASVAMLLYKPIINGLRMANLIPRSEHKSSFNKNTIIILSVGGALLAASVAIFIVLWMR